MLSTRIPTAIVALVAAGSIAAGSLAPQAGAATKSITAASPTAAQISLANSQISAAAPSSIKAESTVAIWTTKFGTGPGLCMYPDGTLAGEGEEATVIVFLDSGAVVSYNIVCTKQGWQYA